MRILTAVFLILILLFPFSLALRAENQVGRYQAVYSHNSGILLSILDTTTGDVYSLKTGEKFPLGTKIPESVQN